MRKLKINPDYLLAQKLSWIDQFRNAANVNEGDVENASAFDYMMHVISFPWKVIQFLKLTD
jgi:solute carrier family 8 (sodium/calcium exchanger)